MRCKRGLEREGGGRNGPAGRAKESGFRPLRPRAGEAAERGQAPDLRQDRPLKLVGGVRCIPTSICGSRASAIAFYGDRLCSPSHDLPPRLRQVVVSSALLLGLLASSVPGFAQQLQNVQDPAAPLVLQSRGSFVIGGESMLQTPTQLGYPQPAGHVTVDQMYVEYMVPRAARGLPVVMLEGATLTGKSYDTIRTVAWAGTSTSSGRATPCTCLTRSPAGARASMPPPPTCAPGGETAERATARRPTDRRARLDALALVAGAGRGLPRHAVPGGSHGRAVAPGCSRLRGGAAHPEPQCQRAMADLAGRLGGALLMGHSQSGTVPVDAFLTDPTGVRGLLLVEPGACLADRYTDEQIAALATVPILTLFSDHLDALTGAPQNWQNVFADCQAFIARVNAAGGAAEMLYPPELGIHGNTHMIMMDKNNLQIADLILQWIDRTRQHGN